MKKIALASVFALAFFAGQAKADGQFSVFAGYLSPGDLNFTNIEQNLTLRDTSLYGARVEVDFLKVFGIEQNFAFSPRILDLPAFPEESSDTRGFLYSSNLVVNIPISRFVPYVTAGLGFIRPWGGDLSDLVGFGTTFAGNYGGGIKLNRLAGPVGLRFDVRGWRTSEILELSGGANILEATGAVTFTWGGD
jgi:hypothetical protein